MFMTMSSSWAPSFMAWRASSALISGSVVPIGKPIVVHILVSWFLSVLRARSM